MSISRKILAALLGLTVGSLVTASLALHALVRDHAQELVVARFQDSLVPAARAVDNLLLDALRGMYLLTSDRTFQAAAGEEMIRRLRGLTYVYPYLERIYIADATGKIAASSDPADISRSAFVDSGDLRAHFESVTQLPRGSIEMAPLEGDSGAPHPVFRLLTRIDDAQGGKPVILVAELLNAPFEEMLRDVDRGARGVQQAYLVDARGRVLLSSSERDSAGWRSSLAANPVLAARLKEEHAGSLVVNRGKNPFVVAYTRLPKYGANRVGG